jgi:cytochrome bd-type quinol oxidase subunit 2
MPDDLAANSVVKRAANWALWSGFILSPIAFLSYFLVFARFPVTRDMPWANFVLFALSLALLFVGLRRAFGSRDRYRGKIAGPILSILSLAVVVFFCLAIFYFPKQLPASSQAPRVGQKAPDFALTDTSGNTVSLAVLLSTPLAASQPAKGVLLVFYRGYW